MPSFTLSHILPYVLDSVKSKKKEGEITWPEMKEPQKGLRALHQIY